jgi:chorismate mutase
MRWRRRLGEWLGVPTVRAIRGAVSVEADEPEALRVAVRALLEGLRDGNQLRGEEVVSALFTVTPDLHCAFPATMAREMGWHTVPLLCATEIGVSGGMPRCLRVLLHVERCWGGREVRHLYLGEAASLRPDLAPSAGLAGRLSAAAVSPTPR